MPKWPRLSAPLKLTCILLSSLFISLDATAQEVGGRWKFTKGDQLHYITEQVTKISGKESQKREPLSWKVSNYLDWKVTKISPLGTVTVSLTLRRHRLEMTIGDAPAVVFDSQLNKKPATQLASLTAIYRALLNQSFQFRLYPSGRISTISLSPGGMKRIALLPTKPPINSIVSADGMQQILGLPIIKFPEKSLTEGVSWESRSPRGNPLLGETELVTTYVIEPMQSGLLPVRMEFSLQRKNGKQRGDITAKITKQSGQGRLVFDPVAGNIKQVDSKSSIHMQWHVNGQEFFQALDSENHVRREAPIGNNDK